MTEARPDSRRLALAAMAAVFLVAAGNPGGTGTVSGRIAVPPRETPGPPADLYGKYKETPSPPTEAPPPARGAVVALVPISGKAPFPSGPPPVMNQSGIRFVPRVVAVQAGGLVRFTNSDPVFHNIFSLSPARKFDLGRYPKGDSRTVTFDKPGVVQVFCDIHSSMLGFVVVLDTPYFAVTGADGSYLLAGVPAGTYRVVAWTEGMTQTTELGRVTVAAGAAVEYSASLAGGR